MKTVILNDGYSFEVNDDSNIDILKVNVMNFAETRPYVEKWTDSNIASISFDGKRYERENAGFTTYMEKENFVLGMLSNKKDNTEELLERIKMLESSQNDQDDAIIAISEEVFNG